MSTASQPQPPQVTPLAEGLTARTFAPALDADGNPDAGTGAFHRAVALGFYESTPTDERMRLQEQVLVGDGQRITGVYVDPGSASLKHWGEAHEQLTYGSEHPVGTFIDFDKTLNAGGPQLIDAFLITGVTVDASYRRRGILKHLMTSRLAAAVEDGKAVALLTASEGSIYGRFGFGPATREHQVRINVSRAGEAFGLRRQPSGRVLTADPSKLGDVIDEVFAGHHAVTRGSVGRLPDYRRYGTGEWTPDDITTPWRGARAIIHVKDDGRIGGYAVFTFRGWDEEPFTMRISDLIAVDAESQIELIRHLSAMDMVERISWDGAPAEDPLRWALVNPRARRAARESDVLWVRVLDVQKALENRAWGADGDFTLEVADPLGIVSGRWRVVVRAGSAQVAAVTGDRDSGPLLRTDAETLGSMYLGDVSVRTMHSAGRAEAAPADLDLISAVMDLPTAPHCATHF
ncbi:GNAT family N-acetyltransferase [Nesterenkonia sp. NBAIMH1]|uniref:GNAT family N-acetyltransferase n=1 Tax=Nesterenkonia sp. NBAIMH1 TaxID=2600320 RepID=UPI00143CE555|nr:GNAT family N-acetyltransferase [Nesterenkonia sp. NBAIMH1]